MGTAGQPANNLTRHGPWLLRQPATALMCSAGAAAGAIRLRGCQVASAGGHTSRGQLPTGACRWSACSARGPR
eukprot:3226669-Alexandrium_andersonii.AAC.1